MTTLTTPEVGGELGWVREHLAHLALEGPALEPSRRFRGGQPAADAALAGYDATGYAATRNEVLPVGRRGASALSPYIRHGLITLPTAWAHVADAPARDRSRFRDELMWQEYARHLYARVGSANASALRREPARGTGWSDPDPWPREMACMDLVVGELETDGWLVNQTRLWAASQWTVRAGAEWTRGEDRFFTHLLDGSRAANRLGWQWAVGAGTGKPYGFSRWQVEKRAPSLCRGCALRERCPVQDWPDAEPGTRVEEADGLRTMPAGAAGPASAEGQASAKGQVEPTAVWLTAESLGGDDPALLAHPDLPAVFVFDEPLLARLRLSGKRLVFLTECLSALGAERELRVHLGDPVAELAGTAVATTFAPVPGWARRAERIVPVVVHPWPWLVRPRGGSVTSYSAWIKTHHR